MSNRVGIEFKQIWALLSDDVAPEAGTVPPTRDTKIDGVKCEFKKNWLKLFAKNGMRMYIARQKVTRQIDLSGWGGATKGMVGIKPATKKNGQVEAHVDLSHEHASSHIVLLLSMMASLPDPEKAKKEVPVTEAGKARKAREATAKPDAASSPMSKLDAASSTERLLRTWELCKRRGVLISEKTLDTLVAQGASMPDDLIAALDAERAKNMPVVSIEEPVAETTLSE